MDTGRRAPFRRQFSHTSVRNDTAAEKKARHIAIYTRRDSFSKQNIHNGLAETGRDIRLRKVCAGVLLALHPARNRRLQPREGEVISMAFAIFRQAQTARKTNRCGVAGSRDPVDVRAAWIGQAKQASDLVERLARCIVDSLAQQLDIRDQIPHVQQRRVPTGDEQRNGRQIDLSAVIAEHICTDMADKVVHGIKRLAGSYRQRFRRRDPDHERPCQPWPARHRDSVELRQFHTRLGERLLQCWLERFEVSSRSNLRHHSPIARVLFHRRRNHVRQ